MGALPTGTVTFLLTDVPDSVERWDEEPDRTSAALARLDEVVEATAAGFGGHLVKPRGENDSYFLVFATVSGAIDAALRLGVTAAAEGLPPVRMALTTGPAELQGGDYLGPIVNRCAQLRAAAHAGQVVVGAPVADAVGDGLPAGVELADLGWHWLKDLEQPLRAFELRHPDLPSDFPSLRSLTPPAPNLALPLTSLVGRDREIAAVLDALADGAPVTVVGAPGVGKSRVATEAAVVVGRTGQSLVRLFLVAADPADLEPSPVPTLVVFDDGDRQRDRLRALIDGRPRSDALSVVVTARAPLGAEGEVIVRVPPLAPEEAACLLADRAQIARPGVALGATSEALTAALCGLPLAIELAAARLAVLSPDQPLARLQATPDRILSSRAAGPSRHRSLMDTVAWTLDDLTAVEREALAGLVAGAPTPGPVMERLADLGWAERTAAGAQVLPVLRPFVTAALGGVARE